MMNPLYGLAQQARNRKHTELSALFGVFFAGESCR